MENVETKIRKKRQVNPDRIVLEVDSVEFIRTISVQIEQAFGGVIKLTNKEVANFVLQSRTSALSSVELKAIKDKYFDDVRAAQWAVQKLKSAKESGVELSLTEVLGQLQMPAQKEKRKPQSVKTKLKTPSTDAVRAPASGELTNDLSRNSSS